MHTGAYLLRIRELKLARPLDRNWFEGFCLLWWNSADSSHINKLGETARWLQLKPSSSWPRLTVSAFQYLRWCALTKPAVVYLSEMKPIKEKSIVTTVDVAVDPSCLIIWCKKNSRRHDGYSNWSRWLQLMCPEGWQRLQDSFADLVQYITQEMCFKYFLNLAGTSSRQPSHSCNHRAVHQVYSLRRGIYGR